MYARSSESAGGTWICDFFFPMAGSLMGILMLPHNWWLRWTWEHCIQCGSAYHRWTRTCGTSDTSDTCRKRQIVLFASDSSSNLSYWFVCWTCDPHQSETGTILSSGWFPTTWSMKRKCPGGLCKTKKPIVRSLMLLKAETYYLCLMHHAFLGCEMW